MMSSVHTENIVVYVVAQVRTGSLVDNEADGQEDTYTIGMASNQAKADHCPLLALCYVWWYSCERVAYSASWVRAVSQL